MTDDNGPDDPRLARIEGLIRDVPDFPRAGIVFKDITPLLGDSEALRDTVELLAERVTPMAPEAVVGIESRGFIFGAALACRLGAAFVPARKPGRLPMAVERADYDLEYGRDTLEMHVDALPAGARAIVCDDLVATGGTAWAAGELVRRLGGRLMAYAFVVELAFLGGRERLPKVPVLSLLRY